MKKIAIKKNATYQVTVSIFIALLTFTIHCLVKMPFLKDNFLLADDLKYIPKWQINGFFFATQGILVFEKLLSLFYWIAQEPGSLRVVIIVFFSISLGIVSFVFLYEISIVPVILMAVLAALIPMGVDQGIFIVGSYPMIGASLIFIAFSLIYLSTYHKRSRGLLIIIGYLFVTLAQLVHPIYSLAPLAFLLLAPAFERNYIYVNIICILTSYLLRVAIMPAKTYHYSSLKGWVDYSIYSLLQQTKISIAYLWSTLSVHNRILIILIGCTGAYFLFDSFLKKVESNNRKILVALFFLFLSVLTFFPTLVLNVTRTRYYYAPQLFLFLSFIMFTAGITQPTNSRKYLVNILYSFLCVSLFFNTNQFQIDRFTKVQQAQHAIKECVSKEYNSNSPTDSKNDQIVFFLNHMPSLFTGAYNHWSTWFLRYQTGNENVIGLVGTKSLCNVDPIVAKYKDHSPEYWSAAVINGKELSYRIHMKGIELNRNTFVFQQTNRGFDLLPYIIIHRNNGDFIAAKQGMPFQKVLPNDPMLKEALKFGYIWPIKGAKYSRP